MQACSCSKENGAGVHYFVLKAFQRNSLMLLWLQITKHYNRDYSGEIMQVLRVNHRNNIILMYMYVCVCPRS